MEFEFCDAIKKSHMNGSDDRMYAARFQELMDKVEADLSQDLTVTAMTTDMLRQVLLMAVDWTRIHSCCFLLESEYNN